MSKIDNTEVSERKRYEDFVSMAIHELKTPVTVLKAYMQMTLLQLHKEKQYSHIKVMEKMDIQLEKIDHLISDLLGAASGSPESIHCLMNDFSLNETLKDCVDNVKATYPRFTIEARPLGHDLTIRGDRERIEQVINNLISNAVKYSGNERYIKIHSAVKDSRVIIIVIDRGVGIPVEKQRQIFKQFYRVESPSIHKLPGLGLGLFICAEIIKKHNGEIGVHSREGKGSEFWFTLPVKDKLSPL